MGEKIFKCNGVHYVFLLYYSMETRALTVIKYSQAMQKLYLISKILLFSFSALHSCLHMGLKGIFFETCFEQLHVLLFVIEELYIFPQIKLWKTCVSNM